MKIKKIYMALVVLVFSVLFSGFACNAEAAANIDRKKFEKFEGIMAATIDKWGTTADFAQCGTISSTELNDFYQYFINENPKYFYASIKKYYIRSVNGTIYADIAYCENARKKKEEYEKKISSILKQVDSKWSDFEKAVFVNDYLTINCEYDTTLTRENSADAYGAIVNQTAVCQGYAMAFMDLMDRLTIPCEYVSSRVLNHGWNIVKIKGKWYHVDVTWNDPISDMKGRSRHYYLLKSTKFFKDAEKGKHNANDYRITGAVEISEVTSTKYDNYFWNDVDSPFVCYSGRWYTVNSETKELIRYAYNKKKGGFIKKEVLLKIEDEWPVWGKEYSHYTQCYSRIAGYKKFLYYSTPDKIYSYNLKNKTQKEIFSNDRAKGYIYGITLKKGKLTYYLMKSPGEEVVGEGTINIK